MKARDTHILKTEKSLAEHCLKGGRRIIKLGKVIPLTRPLLVPDGVEIQPQGYGWEQGGGGSMECLGWMNAGRAQIFEGFGPGEIRGTFRAPSIPVEWWGTDAKAINTAVRAAPTETQQTGHVVSFAAARYLLNAEIDAGASSVLLSGAGPGRTSFRLTADWQPTSWRHAFGLPERADGNHASAVWLGSKTPAVRSFRTGIEGISIECNEAAMAHWDRGEVSGVSSESYIEEGTIIRSVDVFNASGFSVGFPQHRQNGIWQPATVNGLDASGLWLAGPAKRTSIPILTTQWAGNCRFANVTIDMRLTQDHNPSGAVHKRDWPLFGSILGGATGLDFAHVEGCGIAVAVRQGTGQNMVSIRKLDTNHMMNAATGQVYYGDSPGAPPPAGNMDVFGYSCGVLLCRHANEYQPWANAKDSLDLSIYKPMGNCRYALRDGINNLHLLTKGGGQFPEEESYGITRFTRGNAYTPNNFTLIR